MHSIYTRTGTRAAIRNDRELVAYYSVLLHQHLQLSVHAAISDVVKTQEKNTCCCLTKAFVVSVY